MITSEDIERVRDVPVILESLLQEKALEYPGHRPVYGPDSVEHRALVQDRTGQIWVLGHLSGTQYQGLAPCREAGYQSGLTALAFAILRSRIRATMGQAIAAVHALFHGHGKSTLRRH